MSQLYSSFNLNEKECQVVQLKRQKNILKIESHFTVPFPDREEEEPSLQIQKKGEILKAALKERKFNCGEAILLIPKHFVTVRHAFLPSVDAEELDRMARFEAEKHIHFNLERHIISHHIMKKEGVSGSHVLISAADNPVTEEPLSILQAAGIQPSVCSVSSVALYNFFRYLHPSLNDETTYALINIGFLTQELVIIHKGILVFTRSTSHGLSKLLAAWNNLPKRQSPLGIENLDAVDIQNPAFYFTPQETENRFPSPVSPDIEITGETGEYSPDIFPDQPIIITKETKEPADPPREIELLNEWKEKLIQSIRQTYDFARREFDCPPIQNLYISGEGARFKNIDQYLSKNLGIDAEILNTGNIAGGESLRAAYFPALGGALEYIFEEGIHLNLLPRHFVEMQLNRQKRQNIISLGVMILGVIILAILYLRAYTLKQERLYQWYNDRVKTLKPRVTELADMTKKMRVIEGYVRDERNALAILDRVSVFPYIPRSVSLTDFKYKKGESVELSGHALSIKDLNAFIDDLEKTGFFKKVDIKQRPWVPLPNNRPKVLNYTLICAF
ncbi:pilus assembly protein PilM [Candidatus Sumerlaeota bacterium]|nr:pilus assembly protein PilM [Candidatus Sumerlaeota bacterium]